MSVGTDLSPVDSDSDLSPVDLDSDPKDSDLDLVDSTTSLYVINKCIWFTMVRIVCFNVCAPPFPQPK